MKRSILRGAFLLAILTFMSCLSSAENSADRPIDVIAHRGAPGYLPEHTLEGAAMAHAWGVDYIEPDLVMSKDNVLVILHDHHLDTTTDIAEKFPTRARKDGRFYAADFTLKELKRLNVHERVDLKTQDRVFPERFPPKSSSFKIPTFEEFIQLVQGLNKTTGKNVGIYPEIKKPEFHLKEGKDIAKATLKTLRKYGYEESLNAFIQCFWPQTLIRLKNEFKTKIPLVQLIASDSWGESSANYSRMLTDEGLREIKSYANGIGPWINQIMVKENEAWRSTGIVEKAHDEGLVVHPYTHRREQIPAGLSEKQFFDFLFKDLKVDGIFSDFADRALNYLK